MLLYSNISISYHVGINCVSKKKKKQLQSNFRLLLKVLLKKKRKEEDYYWKFETCKAKYLIKEKTIIDNVQSVTSNAINRCDAN